MNSTTSNFQHDIKNINSPNTTIVQSKSHQIVINIIEHLFSYYYRLNTIPINTIL